MLLISSTGKPQYLDALLRPILGGYLIAAKVVLPEELEQENDQVTGQLLMGAESFELLVHHGVVVKKKNQKLGSFREKVFNLYDRPTVVTYDPGMVDFVPELKPQIQWDVHLAIRLAMRGTDQPQVGEYHYVEDFSEVVQWLQSIAEGERYPLACDLETLGLDEFSPVGRILTIQLTYRVGHALVYVLPEGGKPSVTVMEQLKVLFSDSRINTIGANFKYDMRWMWNCWGLEVQNHRFDSQLVGGLVNENRFNSLKDHCKEYAPELGGYENVIEDHYDKARMDIPLKENPKSFLQYSGGDTDAEFRIYEPLKRELLKDPQLSRFYVKLLHPASLVFRQLESRGLLIDKAKYLQLQTEAEAELQKLHHACFELMPYGIRNKYSDNLKLTRDVILREFLFTKNGLDLKPVFVTPKEQEPSCAWAHLKLFEDHPEAGPFVKMLKQYNATAKTLGTYIVGFMKHLRSDGRFHPSYILAKGGMQGDEDESGGTNSGRSSCRDPAWQTLPKRTAWAKRLRSVVVCPPGYVVVKADWSQGELRIMADQSNCKAMIENYRLNQDLHARTAAGFVKMTLEQFWKLSEDQIELLRYLAKAGNFGLIYAVSPEGFQAYAENSYGAKMTIEEAEQYHSDFFKMYPEIHTYHNHVRQFARRSGFYRNPLGRVRHVPLINSENGQIRGKQERQAINGPIQGCLFDLNMLLMVEIAKQREDIWLFGNTHDSLEMYLKEDTWEADVKWIKQVGENLPLDQFEWKPKVGFVLDFEMSSTHLGDLHKVKL